MRENGLKDLLGILIVRMIKFNFQIIFIVTFYANDRGVGRSWR